MPTLAQLRDKFDRILKHIDNRNGINELVKWLESTDFFTAPASTKFHGNYQGGLVEHSIHVVEFGLTIFNWILKYKPEYEYMKESVIFCGLFHDVCKISQYIKEEKWTKDNNNKWVKYMGYSVDDKFPFPHGPKSVYYISKFIELTTPEILAIRWHMGSTEAGTQIDGLTKYAYQAAFEDPLVKIIAASDQLSTLLGDKIDYSLQARII